MARPSSGSRADRADMDPRRQSVDGPDAVTGGRRPMRLPLNYILPIAAGLVFLAGWHTIVTVCQIPKFLVPSPVLIVETMISDAPSLLRALRFTAIVTLSAFFLAVVTGIAVGVLLAWNGTIEITLWPSGVIMEVTTMIGIGRLL